MTDFRKMGIGSATRKVTVKDVGINTVNVPGRDRTSDKIVFTVTNGDNREFNISDVWIEDHKGARKIQGLWFTTIEEKGAKKLSPACALSKLLRYYGADTVDDMIGKEVTVHPDDHDFLVLAACKIETVATEKSNLFD